MIGGSRLSPCSACRRRCRRSSRAAVRAPRPRPPRARASNSTWTCESGSIHGLRCASRPLQRRRVGEQRRPAGDRQQPPDDEVVLARDAGPEPVAQLGLHEPPVALSDPEVGLVERHLERRHTLRKNGQSPYISRWSSNSPSASAAPAPYHLGSSSRFWIQANTHGIARSSSIPPAARLDIAPSRGSARSTRRSASSARTSAPTLGRSATSPRNPSRARSAIRSIPSR